MKTSSRFQRGVIFVFAALFAAVAARADIYTWTGGSGTWDDRTHWQVNGETATQAPGEGEDVLLPAPEDTTGNYTVTATGAINVRHFTIGTEDDSHVGTVTFVSQTKDTHLVAGDLVVAKNAILKHKQHLSSYALNFSVLGAMNVLAGASINVSACGGSYGSRSGPAGPSHGGRGKTDNACTGSIREPIACGDGGYSWQSGYDGGKGGGAARFAVTGALTLDGSILANGSGGAANCYAGAGGSVWLSAAKILGSGTVSAAGGTNAGGGRISLVQTDAEELALPRANITAGSGTIYFENGDDAPGAGELFIKGGGTRDLSNAVGGSTEPFGKITFEGNGVVQVLDGIVIAVRGDVSTASGKLTAANGGGIDICPASSCAMSGTFEVDTLICTNADATVEFASGSALTVHANGTMWLQGEKDHPLTLLSAEPSWTLSVNAGVDAQVKYVAASNSVVLVGMVTDTEGTDLGGNTGWTFPKETGEGTEIYWTGAAGTEDWGTAGNWVDELGQVRAPKPIDAVVIVDGCDLYPTISASTEAYSLTVGAGAALRVANATLSVTHDVTLAADALMMDATSTFVLAGAEAQAADCGGNAFRHLVVAGPDVTFLNGFSAYSFTCEQEGDVALRFSAGDTYEMSEVRVIAADDKVVSLDSTEADSPWYLKAGVGAIFTGVSVKDSNASRGATIATVGFDDRGNNSNWTAGACIWQGTSTTWTDPNNWIGGVPGDSNDVILASATAQPTISSAAVVRSLAVGDGVSAVTLTVNGALTVCKSFRVGDDCMLVANKPIVVSNDFTLASGSQVKHDRGSKIDIFALGDIDIPADVTVTADGAGNYGGSPSKKSAHGGKPNSSCRDCYGSIREPVSVGVEGNRLNLSGYYGGAGGGAIRLRAGKTLTVDGVVTSCGTGGSSGCGAGAGGSVWLTAGTIRGTGRISAEQGYNGSNPGGGGRISLVQTEATELTLPLANVTAGNGTIYLENANDAAGVGTLFLKGGGIRELSDAVEGSANDFASIVFEGTGGELSILNGIVVTVCGDVGAANCTVTATNGGGIDICPATSSVVSGTFEVDTLICTNADATVEFASGSALTVHANGTMWLQGEKNHPLTLLSAESSWTLSVNAGVDAQVKYVAASNSVVLVGMVTDTEGSDLGGNTGWTFPKETVAGTKIFWTGDAGTEDWGTAGNWIDEFDQVRAPKPSDAIVIADGCDPYPTISASTEAYSLTVGAGAALRVANATLSVTHDVTLAADTLTMDATSTFVLAGTEAQAVDCGGNAFRHLVVAGPDVTFRNGFSTYSFTCEQEGDVALRFSAGDTYEMSAVRVVAADDKVVLLDSTEEDSTWYLKAGAGAIFTGVSVKDSDASKGATIATVDFDDRGNNRNWDKGACIWKGTSTAWTDPNNWIGGVPGDSNDVILASATAQPTISSATAVRSLAVGDGVSAVTLTVNGALTVCKSFRVGDDCTLVANRPIVVSNDFTMASGSQVKHDRGSKIDILALDDIDISVDATMTADGAGNHGGSPSKKSAHGGKPNSTCRDCYGSIREPVSVGVEGTRPNLSGYYGGAGGGAIRLRAGKALTVDGTVTSRGTGGSISCGAGAGGSIWLTAGTIRGAGQISAEQGYNGEAPGGGGRISLVLTEATALALPLANVTAGNGTIYLENANDAAGVGTLFLKGGGIRELSDAVEGSANVFARVVFEGTGGELSILNGVVVPVCGDVDAAAGTVTAAEGTRGGLDLCATGGVQHVAGTLNLGALVATNGAEEIEFAAGKTVTVADNGVLWLEGGERRKMRLRSSVPGTQWQIDAGANLAGKVRNLDVSDSNAIGETIRAKRSVGRSKRANNRNWEFPSGMALIIR